MRDGETEREGKASAPFSFLPLFPTLSHHGMQSSAPPQGAQGRRGGVLLQKEAAGPGRGVPRGPGRGGEDEVEEGRRGGGGVAGVAGGRGRGEAPPSSAAPALCSSFSSSSSSLEEGGVEGQHGLGGQGEGCGVRRGLGERCGKRRRRRRRVGGGCRHRRRRRRRRPKRLDDDDDGLLCRQQLAEPQGGSLALLEGRDDVERGEGPVGRGAGFGKRQGKKSFFSVEKSKGCPLGRTSGPDSKTELPPSLLRFSFSLSLSVCLSLSLSLSLSFKRDHSYQFEAPWLISEGQRGDSKGKRRGGGSSGIFGSV